MRRDGNSRPQRFEQVLKFVLFVSGRAHGTAILTQSRNDDDWSVCVSMCPFFTAHIWRFVDDGQKYPASHCKHAFNLP